MNELLKQTQASKKATGNRKHSIIVKRSENPSVLIDTNWSGGSQSTFRMVSSGGVVGYMWPSTYEFIVPWNGGPGTMPEPWPIPAGHVVLKSGTFRGKTATPCLIGRPEDVDRILALWGIK